MTRIAALVVLAILYALASTASINVFMSKASLFEGWHHQAYAFERFLDGTAHRPFAYRVLMPALVNATEATLPEAVARRYQPAAADLVKRYSPRPGGEFWTDSLQRRFMLTFLWMNVFAFAALWAFRDLLANALPDNAMLRDLGPLAAGVAIPLMYMNGGFLYDPADLFFGFLILALAWRRRTLWLLPTIVLATLNKETAALSVPLASIVLWHRCDRTTWRTSTASMGLVAAVTVAWVFVRHASLPGSTMYDHVAENLEFWTTPRSWLLGMAVHTPLILLPRGLNLLMTVPLIVLLLHGWRRRPAVFRQILVASSAINLPLFFLFCYRDETRNLLLMTPSIALNLAAAALAASATHDGRPGHANGTRATP
jgi:hypothetical protein